MTQSEYDNFLIRLGTSQKDIKTFLDNVLFDEEDALSFVGRVREFCNDRGVYPSTDNYLGLQFTRALISMLISWRTRNGYKGAETVFDKYLPKPDEAAVRESWRHKDNQEREFRHRSERRRGFYRNGEPTQTCGEDLKRSLELYEYQTKGKTTRT